jgi:hypothetical protein
MANEIDRPRAPTLPYARKEHTATFFDQYSTILRLFFTRFVGVFDSLFSTDEGGKFLYFPRGAAYSAVDQTAAVINTGYPVEFEVTTVVKGVSVAGGSNTQLTVTDPGTYSFRVDLQAYSSGGGNNEVTVYAKLSGTSVAYSAKVHTVRASGYQIIPFNYSAVLTAGQYVEVYWATTSTNVSLNATATAGVHAGIASATAAMSFVSNG